MPDTEPITPASIENLDLAIRELADHVDILRQVLDEIREDISYAVRNGQFVVVPIPLSGGSTVKSLTREVDDVIDRMTAISGKLQSLKTSVSEQACDTAECGDCGSPFAPGDTACAVAVDDRYGPPACATVCPGQGRDQEAGRATVALPHASNRPNSERAPSIQKLLFADDDTQGPTERQETESAAAILTPSNARQQDRLMGWVFNCDTAKRDPDSPLNQL